MSQRRSSVATRRASARSGVARAAVRPGSSRLARSIRAIAAASSRGPGVSIRVKPSSARSAKGASRWTAAGHPSVVSAGRRASASRRARPGLATGSLPSGQGRTSPRSTPSRSKTCRKPNCGCVGPSASQLASSSSRSRPGRTTAPCSSPVMTARRSPSAAVVWCVKPAAITGLAGGASSQRRAKPSRRRTCRSTGSTARSAATMSGQCSRRMRRKSSVSRQCAAWDSGASASSADRSARAACIWSISPARVSASRAAWPQLMGSGGSRRWLHS